MVSKKSIQKIPQQLMNRADVIAGLLSVIANQGGITHLLGNVKAIMTNPVVPDLEAIFTISVPSAIGQGLMPIAAGVIIDMIDLPSLNKFSTPLIKTGVGLMAGRIASGFLNVSHNPGGGETMSGTSTSNVWTVSRSAGPITTSARKLSVTAQQPSALPSN